jgi:hypothetical protein
MQKESVKEGLAKALGPGKIWQPLSLAWFEKWKMYVDFDSEDPDSRSAEEQAARHPALWTTPPWQAATATS